MPKKKEKKKKPKIYRITFSLKATRAEGEAKRYTWFMIKNMVYFSKNPTSGLRSVLLVAKSAGFENQNKWRLNRVLLAKVLLSLYF